MTVVGLETDWGGGEEEETRPALSTVLVQCVGSGDSLTGGGIPTPDVDGSFPHPVRIPIPISSDSRQQNCNTFSCHSRLSSIVLYCLFLIGRVGKVRILRKSIPTSCSLPSPRLHSFLDRVLRADRFQVLRHRSPVTRREQKRPEALRLYHRGPLHPRGHHQPSRASRRRQLYAHTD